MKSFGFSAIFAIFAIGAANGAYPVYPVQQTGQRVVYQQPQQVVYQQPQQVVYQQPMVQNQVYLPASTRAVPNTRVTGQLPRVGSNVSNAGRQYYQPSDYDRLADSGLYIGLSAGYSVSVSGGMTADYQGEEHAYFVPGAFQEANFGSDTVIPLQVSLGAAINNNVRVDFSYTRYGDIGYADTVMTSDGAGGYVESQATGGAITANATMLNIYYNIDSYTGFLMGGDLRPYVGVGVGLSLNTIADYVVYDPTFYAEVPEDLLPSMPAGELTGISDVFAYHNGGTTENLAYMLEAGVSTDLSGGLKLDFFVRYSGLGKVKPSGSIVVSQTEWLADGAGGENPAQYDSVFHYTNWYESGNIGTVDVGVRLRLQF